MQSVLKKGNASKLKYGLLTLQSPVFLNKFVYKLPFTTTYWSYILISYMYDDGPVKMYKLISLKSSKLKVYKCPYVLEIIIVLSKT